MYSSTTQDFGNFGHNPGVKFVVARDSAEARLAGPVGAGNLHVLYSGGGKFLAANENLAQTRNQPRYQRCKAEFIQFQQLFLPVRWGIRHSNNNDKSRAAGSRRSPPRS